MNNNIRLAHIGEFAKIRAFYHEMTDWLDTVPYGPGWKKDIYPAPEDLENAINNQQLWVHESDSGYAASMILNSVPTEGYENVVWRINASGDEVLLIHALGVRAEFQHRGIAKSMVNHAIGLGVSKNCKAMRLDVLEGNIPAENLYPKLGFYYVDTVNMFYEDTGWANYKLYERKLP